jgi:hypothetical protein
VKDNNESNMAGATLHCTKARRRAKGQGPSLRRRVRAGKGLRAKARTAKSSSSSRRKQGQASSYTAHCPLHIAQPETARASRK